MFEWHTTCVEVARHNWIGWLMHLTTKVTRHIASLPAYLAFHWTNQPAASAIAERRHPGSLRRNMVVDSLLPNEAAVVEGLRSNGVFVTDLDKLGLCSEQQGETIATSGRLVATRLAARAAEHGARPPDMIVSEPADLLRNAEIYRWGLNAVLLRIAEAYLCQPVAYDGALVFYTPADGREVATRRWHLDREDVRMIKVGLYLNDVDEAGGPFQILRHEKERAGARIDYRARTTAGLSRWFGDVSMPSDVVTCTGKSGSLVFADTARFYHRGKPATGQDRSAIFFSYFARLPRHPFFCERSRLSRHQIAKLIEGLHPAQQASALWRDELSMAWRMIPSSLS